MLAGTITIELGRAVLHFCSSFRFHKMPWLDLPSGKLGSPVRTEQPTVRWHGQPYNTIWRIDAIPAYDVDVLLLDGARPGNGHQTSFTNAGVTMPHGYEP